MAKRRKLTPLQRQAKALAVAMNKPPLWKNPEYREAWEEAIVLACCKELVVGERVLRPHPQLGPMFAALRIEEYPRNKAITAEALCKKFPDRFEEKYLNSVLRRLAYVGVARMGQTAPLRCNSFNKSKATHFYMRDPKDMRAPLRRVA